MRARAVWVAVSVVAVLCAACSSGGGDKPSAEAASERKPSPPTSATVPVPEVTTPPAGKGAIVLGPPGIAIDKLGYTESEFFLAGKASAYASATPLTADGMWNDVKADSSADYVTRIVVRRPADPAKFNGTVFVEWLNVSGGLDADIDWNFASPEIVRSGAAWVGVSAQKVGVEGGGNSLGAALALKNADADRYAALTHPGDDYSYDMFSQAGRAIWDRPQQVLSGLTPERVIAVGESQSAFRLSSYVNAVAPTADIFDGYLIHSRGSRGAPLASAPRAAVDSPEPTLVRTDLGVPVFTVSSESDVTGDRLGYARARQPDTDMFRSWEIAGTAHGDAYSLGIGDDDDGSGAADAALFAAMQSPPDGIYGGVLKCDRPLNAGPHTYVLRSAFRALDQWVRTGEAPVVLPRLELKADGSDYVRDERGIAQGGIRTPQVDVPIAVLSAAGQSGQSFCGLFGTTAPFDAATLRAFYPDHQNFVAAWDQATDSAVQSGAILEVDAAQLKRVAAASQIGS